MLIMLMIKRHLANHLFVKKVMGNSVSLVKKGL